MTLEFILILLVIIMIISFILAKIKKRPKQDFRSVDSVLPEVRERLNSDEDSVKIIKYVREETGLGLIDAKALVDREKGDGTRMDDKELADSVDAMLLEGESEIKIIKHVRTETGLGLKDAKDYVDEVKNKQ
ncbi:ribosomal protein L7/L12 [Corticicoccus populi]|uniref:Ribosomal protein L7/L12 n=1 Tax=Corticicoccus populi TaxID=1812821 RepID=A0ABW5WUQ3_9STAP